MLASDVFESGAAVDRLLFGTLLGLEGTDLALSAAAPPRWRRSRTLALGRAWTALTFDPDGAPARSACRPARADLLLLALVAVAAVAAIPAVGALLVTAIFVLPAAAARLVARSVRALIAWALALALAEGVRRPLPRLLARRAARPAGRGAGRRAPTSCMRAGGAGDERAVASRASAPATAARPCCAT